MGNTPLQLEIPCVFLDIPHSDVWRRQRVLAELNEKKVQDMPLSSKADAAFRQAEKKIIQRARQTGTPFVVWEEGHIKEILGEEFSECGSGHVN
jgi:hypothetical protein